tara:strand:+ start:15830 stop:16309 length:480 start_codon:yes stop_codon:yes gene_type:complete
MTNNRIYNIKVAIERLKKFCSIQDRCQQDVINKLRNWGLTQNSQDHILEILINESYIDEMRYAKSFCRGKFNIKKWGKNKIKYELKKKNISKNCIAEGLNEIDDCSYLNILEKIYNKKKENTSEKNIIIKNNKIAAFLISKGFERNLVWEVIKDKNYQN